MNKKKIVGKSAVHYWMNVNFGKPKKCDNCGTTDENKVYEWANKDHKYRRKRGDFKRLCRSCHRKYDGIIPPSRKGKHHSKEAKLKIRKFALTMREWDENGFMKVKSQSLLNKGQKENK